MAAPITPPSTAAAAMLTQSCQPPPRLVCSLVLSVIRPAKDTAGAGDITLNEGCAAASGPRSWTSWQ
ncbi:hypothetical protein GCM10023107_94740 [Actinoplanes octamycinicus]|nr:hypothetical protein Aoc01nite_22650 [Actinoplanes octamycinicus]